MVLIDVRRRRIYLYICTVVVVVDVKFSVKFMNIIVLAVRRPCRRRQNGSGRDVDDNTIVRWETIFGY